MGTRIVLGLVAAAGLAACGPAPADDWGHAGPAAGVVVDSAVPREQALRRFREGVPVATGLTGGAPSREALVRAFVRATEAADTAALRALALTRAEFAWLYYPTTPQGLPPYDLSPALLWFVTEGASSQGLGRLLAERAGRPLEYAGHACDPTPSVEGENRVWGPCVVRRLRAPGDTVAERLFGQILERGGRFKLVSLANRI
jgi:hypothetical protein